MYREIKILFLCSRRKYNIHIEKHIGAKTIFILEFYIIEEEIEMD